MEETIATSGRVNSDLEVAGDKSSVGCRRIQAAGQFLVLVQSSPGAARLEGQGEVLELLRDLLELELLSLLLGGLADLAAEILVDTAEQGCVCG